MTNTTKKKLAGMWCELNSFRWPKELEKYEIEGFEIKSPIRQKICISIMTTIQIAIGKDECLKEWRKRHDDLQKKELVQN